MRKTGLADSPFFKLESATPSPDRPKVVFATQANEPKPEFQTSRVTEFQTPEEPDNQTPQLPDFQHYEVPDYRKMPRIEARLTWAQNRYLEDLEYDISRARAEGERGDSQYKRITKNSIVRVLVEIARQFELQVDARSFKNERDLLQAIIEELTKQLTNYQSSRLPE